MGNHGAPTLVANDFFAAGCVLGKALARSAAPTLDAVNAGFPAHEIGAIMRHLRSQRDVLEGKWHEHFGN
jgi:hypothetical protein